MWEVLITIDLIDVSEWKAVVSVEMNFYKSMYFEIKYVFVSHWQCIWMNIKLKVRQLGIKIDIFKPNVILVYLAVFWWKWANLSIL